MSLISRLFQAPVNFVEHKVDEVRGEVRAELADGLTSVSIYALLASAGLFCILFLSIALAILIGLWSGNVVIGFSVMGVLYLLVTAYIWRLTQNKPYMEKLRAKFYHWMKVPLKQGTRNKKEAAPFENDV